MKPLQFLLASVLLAALGTTAARADCQIADAKLEEAILQNPQLRGPANRQSVRALRSLRDAAFTLRSYGRHSDCERLIANIRELIAGPSMDRLGDNDEDEAEKQSAAREPKVQRGAVKVSQERDSFFLPLSSAAVKTVPLMPDQDYRWLADQAWRDRNDALFAKR